MGGTALEQLRERLASAAGVAVVGEGAPRGYDLAVAVEEALTPFLFSLSLLSRLLAPGPRKAGGGKGGEALKDYGEDERRNRCYCFYSFLLPWFFLFA